MSTILQSAKVIENLRKVMDSDAVYPYAFGYAWAMLSEQSRKEILKMAEVKANKKEGN